MMTFTIPYDWSNDDEKNLIPKKKIHKEPKPCSNMTATFHLQLLHKKK